MESTLLKFFQKAEEQGRLPDSFTRQCDLIPKADEDAKRKENCKPVSLTNKGAETLNKTLANWGCRLPSLQTIPETLNLQRARAALAHLFGSSRPQSVSGPLLLGLGGAHIMAVCAQ